MQTMVKFTSFKSSFDQYFDIPAKSRFQLFFLTFSENSALLKSQLFDPHKRLGWVNMFLLQGKYNTNVLWFVLWCCVFKPDPQLSNSYSCLARPKKRGLLTPWVLRILGQTGYITSTDGWQRVNDIFNFIFPYLNLI